MSRMWRKGISERKIGSGIFRSAQAMGMVEHARAALKSGGF
jgi:hypothetical protein